MLLQHQSPRGVSKETCGGGSGVGSRALTGDTIGDTVDQRCVELVVAAGLHVAPAGAVGWGVSWAMAEVVGKSYVAYGAQHQVIENSGKRAQMPPETPAVCHAGPSAHGRGRREKKTTYSLQPCTAQSSATPSVMWVITGPDIDVLHTGRKTRDGEMKESAMICISEYISVRRLSKNAVILIWPS